MIICLGKETFKGVKKAFAIACDLNKISYNKFITQENPQRICFANGKVVPVFAMAHCGAVGTMNRNRGALTGDDKLALQKKDWSAIKQYLV